MVWRMKLLKKHLTSGKIGNSQVNTHLEEMSKLE